MNNIEYMNECMARDLAVMLVEDIQNLLFLSF